MIYKPKGTNNSDSYSFSVIKEEDFSLLLFISFLFWFFFFFSFRNILNPPKKSPNASEFFFLIKQNCPSLEMDILSWNGNNFGVFKLKEFRKTQPDWIFIFNEDSSLHWNGSSLFGVQVFTQHRWRSILSKIEKGQSTNHKMND